MPRARDVDYMIWVKTQPCLVASDLCEGGIDAHHAGKRHGMSTKADDATCIPLCHRHHIEWHGACGPFKGWSKDQRHAFAVESIAKTQAAHEGGAARRAHLWSVPY